MLVLTGFIVNFPVTSFHNNFAIPIQFNLNHHINAQTPRKNLKYYSNPSVHTFNQFDEKMTDFFWYENELILLCLTLNRQNVYKMRYLCNYQVVGTLNIRLRAGNRNNYTETVTWSMSGNQGELWNPGQLRIPSCKDRFQVHTCVNEYSRIHPKEPDSCT